MTLNCYIINEQGFVYNTILVFHCARLDEIFLVRTNKSKVFYIIFVK